MAPWEQFGMYFMFRGRGRDEVFAVRTFYDRPFGIGHRPRLLEVIDDWNRQTLWPKVYTHTGDDGAVHLVGEARMLIGGGVGVEFFLDSTMTWLRASIEFDDWFVQRLGLLREVDE